MNKPVFEPVANQFSFPAAEHEVRAFWEREKIYELSLEQRRGCAPYVFYEGPPTANGLPHPGHCLTRTVKDVFPRYQTMNGRYCERKAGWDTHGLPVEVEVCKELGIADAGKKGIEAFGVERFNRKCLESVFRYTREWEQLTRRLGFWVNLDEAYVTYHQSYVESVWWALKTLFDRGLLYQGHKVVWWWAQGGTALSSGEVSEGYRETDDPAITVLFRLTQPSKAAVMTKLPSTAGIEHVALLAWTTTPWTLSSNCALAVKADVDYAVVRSNDERFTNHVFVVAAALLQSVFKDGTAEVLATLPGHELVNLAYHPLFTYAPPTTMDGTARQVRTHVVLSADFVTTDSGTGIVHLAPAFGEDDYRTCRDQDIGFLCFVKPDGTFDERVTDLSPVDQTPLAGKFCKDADRHIIKLLEGRGQLYHRAQYRHPYPFCPRAENDPLIQYARKSWFVRTQQYRGQFLANNQAINWQPEHIKSGRFGNFLENNVDWALSRERFWGTPLPIWQCDVTGRQEAIGSYQELLDKPGVDGTQVWEQAKAADPALSDHLKVHKPYIDAIHYQSPYAAGGRMRRVPEVIDVWFDAGAMPFAQWGYPHQPGSADKVKTNYPADFISEALDQTRGWFYVLLAESTILFDGNTPTPVEPTVPRPFRNVICLGLLLGEDGLKLSKRKKNYREPSYLFDQYGADALRWSLLASQPPTASVRFTEKGVEEALREFLIRWYNVYSFFCIYAGIDGFNPVDLNLRAWERPMMAPKAELDRWVLGELQRTIREVRSYLDHYEPYQACQVIVAFVDGLSNWYVRRARPRFWGSGLSPDKVDAHRVLYTCLVTLAQLCAPFTPFFSEFTWQTLVATPFGNAAPKSVHLSDFPVVVGDPDAELSRAMALVRQVVSLGLAARTTAQIKVRQPLERVEVVLSDPALAAVLMQHLSLIQDELNVKQVHFSERPEEFVSYQIRPNFKVLGPKLRSKQNAAKHALAQADGARLYAELQSGQINLALGDGATVQLTAEDIEVRLEAKPGFTAAQGTGVVVVLATEITAELRAEGQARELIHHLQQIRKDMNLEYAARIEVEIGTSDKAWGAVIEQFSSQIANEVLATRLVSRLVDPSQAPGKIRVVEGQELSFDVRAAVQAGAGV